MAISNRLETVLEFYGSIFNTDFIDQDLTLLTYFEIKLSNTRTIQEVVDKKDMNNKIIEILNNRSRILYFVCETEYLPEIIADAKKYQENAF